jgi:hypothetical protein
MNKPEPRVKYYITLEGVTFSLHAPSGEVVSQGLSPTKLATLALDLLGATHVDHQYLDVMRNGRVVSN